MSQRKVTVRGFSLIEVLVAIAIMAILLALAAPSFTTTIANTRMTSQVNDLIADITYARSESANRGGAKITICASPAGTVCDGANWTAGRLIFVDSNGNGAYDAGETKLKITPALSGDTTLSISGFAHGEYIQFAAYGGLSPATPGSFQFCSAKTSLAKKITVQFFGYPTTITNTCA